MTGPTNWKPCFAALVLSAVAVVSGLVAAIGLGGLWWLTVALGAVNTVLFALTTRDRYANARAAT